MIKGWCEAFNFLCLILKVVKSNVCCGHKYKHNVRMCSSCLDEPPKITVHPRSFGCSEDGHTAIREHFHVLVDAVSKMGMIAITVMAYSKMLITDEVKNFVLSVNGTSEQVKANILVSAIEERIKGDPSAFNTFVEILRLEPAYKHLADKLTSELL